MVENGSSRCFSGQKRTHLNTIAARECCGPYLIGRHSISPVCGEKRPGAPDYYYFAQLPLFFGHFVFPSGGLLEQTNTDHESNEQENFVRDVEIANIFPFFSNKFETISFGAGNSKFVKI